MGSKFCCGIRTVQLGRRAGGAIPVPTSVPAAVPTAVPAAGGWPVGFGMAEPEASVKSPLFWLRSFEATVPRLWKEKKKK